jgi:predicted glycoside hydrolase/deacetylase ChbG (UPF0249 family)
VKQLIVNADDFNTDAARNRGIIEAAAQGIVTSTTVITNTAWPEHSLEQLKHDFAGKGIGVHLNLTKGRPLSRGLSSLTGPDGIFFSKMQAWQRALRRGFDQGQAEREFIAQIEALYAAGFEPDHIDVNNHIQVFPGLAAAAAAAASRFGIRCIRLPREPLLWSLRRPSGAIKKIFIYLLSLKAARIFHAAGLRFPDRCAGLHMPATTTALSIAEFMRRLPEGSTELMCHPGYEAPDNPFSTAEREQELRALTAATVKDTVTRNSISLIRFSDLPCA